jgi:hypothetical protein
LQKWRIDAILQTNNVWLYVNCSSVGIDGKESSSNLLSYEKEIGGSFHSAICNQGISMCNILIKRSKKKCNMYNKEPFKLHFIVNYFTFWILTHLLPCMMSNSPGHHDSSGQYIWQKLKTWYAKVEFITPRFSLDLWSNLRTGIDSISFFFHYISYSIIFSW